MQGAACIRYTCPTMAARLLRSIHLYLGLLLTPWICMYAISTIAMNHREVHSAGGGDQPEWTPESGTWTVAIPAETDPKTKARIVLAALGMEGAHAVSAAKPGQVVIHRHGLIRPLRITYEEATGVVTIERRAETRLGPLLERMHRRRGYQQPFTADRIWAVSVDLVIVALITWVVSGLWLWWEIRAARLAGAACLAAGAAVFALFAVLL